MTAYTRPINILKNNLLLFWLLLILPCPDSAFFFFFFSLEECRRRRILKGGLIDRERMKEPISLCSESTNNYFGRYLNYTSKSRVLKLGVSWVPSLLSSLFRFFCFGPTLLLPREASSGLRPDLSA